MKKEGKNYLDFVPVPEQESGWEADGQGIVTIHMVNRGFYNWLARRIFKRPQISHIRLDDTGSLAWSQMDGNRSIYEIAVIMESYSSEAVGPGYSRIAEFFRILYRNHFIGYLK